jgi:flagellar hook-associated protein 2
MATVNLAGLASGFDWNSFVNQMVAAEQIPEQRYRSQQGTILQENNAYGSIKTELGVLTNRLTNLKDPNFFASRLPQSSDSTVATASATTSAALGQYAFQIGQMATAAVQQGVTNIGASLNATNDVSGLVLSNAAFNTPITAGSFTVNGKQIQVTTTENLQQVFADLSTATGGAVTGSYDAASDKISFSSAGEIVLGSATDSSNFLQAAKLNNNGTGAVTSTAPLGVVRVGGALANANLATAITDGGSGAGQFKINGVAISFSATGDSMTDVINRINNSAAGVTASYDAINDKMVLTSKVTGDVGIALEDDTGNFLAATGLRNTGTVNGLTTLNAGMLSSNLGGATLPTAISDGGHGAGQFLVNGVAVSFNATSDNLQNVIDRINSSAAGVTASYDTTNNRLVFASNTAGASISLKDSTGNFLAATGMAAPALQHGTDLLYNINGGGELTSHSNTISSDSSGLTGLSVTALDKGTTTITVASDTATIKQAISDFVTEFNKVQSMIASQTASTTDSTGKVTAGLLANDRDASDLSNSLRDQANAVASGLAGTIHSLDDLGIVSNGYDDTLSLGDGTRLDTALANNLSGVQALFTDATNGLATKLGTFLNNTIGDNGTLIAKQTDLTKQSTAIDTQVANMEKVIQADKQRMINEFTAMEAAQAKINQQLTYLTQTFGGSSSSSSSSKSSG